MTDLATTPASAFWAVPGPELVRGLGSGPDGLSDAAAAERLAAARAAEPRRHGPGAGRELLRQFTQPIVLILLVAVGLSLLLGDRVDALIILTIVVLSGLLGFWQEHGANVTVARLLDQVQIHVEVRRGGRVTSVSPAEVVPGDVVVLTAGDVVPCDCRVLTSQSLQADESALTGETYPRHKHEDPAPADAPMAERHSALFQGSHVVSGQGEALAVVTGAQTQLGQLAGTLAAAPPPTSFEKGTARFGLLLARVTGVLTAVILVVNLSLGRPVIEAVLFSLALAVGVTPQMLPAIVTVSLSTGARRMARAKVVVRRLDAIEDLGSMDVLCTDKTGTLTEGAIRLHGTVDPAGRPDPRVAELAAVNAGLQTGFANPLDAAVLAGHPLPPGWRRLGEVPFDFERKRLSVLVDGPEGRRVLTKGAYATVLDVCTAVATASGPRPLAEAGEEVEALFTRLSSDGFRVLAMAEREAPGAVSLAPEDEHDLVLAGLLVLEDPPKAGAGDTVAALRGLGVRLCMLTGDNHLVAGHVSRAVGLGDGRVMTGSEVDALDDRQLTHAARTVDTFAELTPAHKERLITAVRAGGSVVGYLGDGINDAASLHLADVGISVDTAVDVARSAASMVLLDKNLDVVVDGVRLGRQTFANTLKYVYTTISANFGNTASMAAASAFLPFLPLLPRQILLLNFLSDLPSVTIAADRVDTEDTATPRTWDLRRVRDFMVVFGLLSTGFDLLTFAVLLQGFDADAELFRTGWFVGSTLTELAVLFVLRTRRSFLRSRPGRALVVSSLVVAVATLVLPFVPDLREPLGLTRPSLGLVLTLLAITAGYVVAAELTKRVYHRPSTAPVTGRRPPVPAEKTQEHRLRRIAREHGHGPAR